jgi:pyrroline-5-carboxylate reductase
MGGAMLKGWLKLGAFSQIHVVEPKPSPDLLRLAGAKAITLRPVLEAGDFSVAILAIKPQVLKGEIDLLRALGSSGALVLSIAAGITTKTLSAHLGPRARIVRAMPNTPGAIGKGITALYAPAKLAPRERTLVETLTGTLGQTLWVSEEKMIDGVTAVSGSGPAYVFLLAEALAAAAEKQGFDTATAEKLARATVSGAGALLEADSRQAAILRQEVTSPGGTTAAALEILMAKDGLTPLMTRAVKAAAKRSRELGK